MYGGCAAVTLTGANVQTGLITQVSFLNSCPTGLRNSYSTRQCYFRTPRSSIQSSRNEVSFTSVWNHPPRPSVFTFAGGRNSAGASENLARLGFEEVAAFKKL